MKNKMRKIITMLLCMAMLLSLLPITVFAESKNDTRTKVSTIVATSNISSIAVYGEKAIKPTFNVTKGSPAYFLIAMSYWEKKNGSSWERYAGSFFTEGTYRFAIQIRIAGEYGTTHVLDKNGVSVTVDGVKWIGESSPYVASDYSYGWTISKEYVIKEPESAPFDFIQLASLKVGANWMNTAITPIDIAKYATGGTRPYRFSKVSGPEWLNVSSDGIISGTPTAGGKNDNFVFRVSDSASASKVITLTVDDTQIKPEDRTKVSTIIATSNISSIAAYGQATKKPTFSITKGSPAYFATMFYWEKKNGSSWERYSGTFTEGTYRFAIQFRIDGKSGSTHMLDKNGVSVTVDGVKWSGGSSPVVGRDYSYDWAISCEYQISEPTPGHTHTYDKTWKSDDTSHWKECTDAACPDPTDSVKDKAAHTPGAAATETTPQTCTTCGYVIKAATGHTHNFNQMNTDKAYLKSAATCTEKAKYYYSCSCGESGTSTFEYGDAPGHSFEETWSKGSGTHYHKCTACGARKDEAAHTPDADGKCTVCGYKKSGKGDLNGDGKVGAADLIIMRKYIAGYDVEIDLNAADFNGDGKVNSKDLVSLRRLIAGYDV